MEEAQLQTQHLEEVIQFFQLSHQLVAVVQVHVTKQVLKLLVVQVQVEHNTAKEAVQEIHRQFLHHKEIQDTKVHQIPAEAVAAVVQVKQAYLIVAKQVVQVVTVQQIQSQVHP